MIIVSKSGAVLSTRDAGTNARGEQAGTYDMIQRLVDRGHDVMFFGRVKGELPCPVVVPYTPGRMEFTTAAEQQEYWDIDEEALRAHGLEPNNPKNLWIQSQGMPSPWSVVDNAGGINPMITGKKYNGPAIAMMHRFGIKRVIFTADIRAYPKDGEMSVQWPDIIPIGLLDQRSIETTTIIAGTKYLRRHVYSESESWPYIDIRPRNEGSRSMLVGSHAHIATGFKKRHRDAAWADLLTAEMFDALPDAYVIGEGFEQFSQYHERPDRYCGAFPPNDLAVLMATTRVSPVVAPDQNFITNKPYLVKALGCIPLLYSNLNNPHAWDPHGTVVPLGHACRVVSGDDIVKAAAWTDSARTAILDELHDMMPQRFTVLDSMIDSWLEGLYWRDPATWWDRYGGFRTLD